MRCVGAVDVSTVRSGCGCVDCDDEGAEANVGEPGPGSGQILRSAAGARGFRHERF